MSVTWSSRAEWSAALHSATTVSRKWLPKCRGTDAGQSESWRAGKSESLKARKVWLSSFPALQLSVLLLSQHRDRIHRTGATRRQKRGQRRDGHHDDRHGGEEPRIQRADVDHEAPGQTAGGERGNESYRDAGHRQPQPFGENEPHDARRRGAECQ